MENSVETAFGKRVTIATPQGQLSGIVVGAERRDISRNGGGRPVPFVCVRPDTDDCWRWVPAAVTTT